MAIKLILWRRSWNLGALPIPRPYPRWSVRRWNPYCVVAPRPPTSWTFVVLEQPGCYSRTTSDQHQPASSRATATLAITGFLFRSVKFAPPLVESLIPRMATCPRGRWSQLPAGLGPVLLSLTPGTNWDANCPAFRSKTAESRPYPGREVTQLWIRAPQTGSSRSMHHQIKRICSNQASGEHLTSLFGVQFASQVIDRSTGP